MGEALGVIAIVTGLFAVGLILLADAGRRSLHRRNRVSRKSRSRAPLHWLWWPAHAARLHRRLVRSLDALRTAQPPRARHWRRAPAEPSTLSRAVAELEVHAVELDARLVVAGRLTGSHRREALDRLTPSVEKVEHLAVRLIDETRALAAVTDPATELDRLRDELEALRSARADLEAVDRRAGLLPG